MTMNAVIPTDVSVASDAPFRPKRVPVGSPAYNEITEFLYEEAWLLDEIRLAECSNAVDAPV